MSLIDGVIILLNVPVLRSYSTGSIWYRDFLVFSGSRRLELLLEIVLGFFTVFYYSSEDSSNGLTDRLSIDL